MLGTGDGTSRNRTEAQTEVPLVGAVNYVPTLTLAADVAVPPGRGHHACRSDIHVNRMVGGRQSEGVYFRRFDL